MIHQDFPRYPTLTGMVSLLQLPDSG